MPPALRARACPRDHTPLVAEKVQLRGPDVTLDRCPACGGTFLDKNELARVSGDLDLNRYLRDEVGLDSDSELVCPSCGGIMDAEEVAGVEVDVCLTCFGLWLDKGELDTLKGREGGKVALTPEKRGELGAAAYAERRRRRGLLAKMDAPFAEFVRRYL